MFMKIVCLPVTAMQENAYFYYDEETKAGIVIDPGGEPQRLCRFIEDNSLKIVGILLTHGHFDHILAVSAIKAVTAAPVACHADEAAMLRSAKLNFSSEVGRETGIEPDILFNDGDIFEFGGHKINVIHTPGHTIGGVSYYCEESSAVFSGDTLFYDSVGRTDFPGGSSSLLTSSIKDKLFSLPDDTIVYPGHGDSTTIRHEKANNPFVRL
jgi:glyoxylase-like metal-dependent hydrolase (beta-lactamase superfamily II)